MTWLACGDLYRRGRVGRMAAPPLLAESLSMRQARFGTADVPTTSRSDAPQAATVRQLSLSFPLFFTPCFSLSSVLISCSHCMSYLVCAFSLFHMENKCRTHQGTRVDRREAEPHRSLLCPFSLSLFLFLSFSLRVTRLNGSFAVMCFSVLRCLSLSLCHAVSAQRSLPRHMKGNCAVIE